VVAKNLNVPKYSPEEAIIFSRKNIGRKENSIVRNVPLYMAGVGVEFMPFGNRSGGNSTEALNVLRRLDEEYG